MAPEILKGYPYNIKGDIWSLGVVLYEMLFGICPFEDKSLAGLIYQIDKKPLAFPREINNISQSTENLLRRMLVLDHRNRIDWNELLEYKINVVTEDKSPILRTIDNNVQNQSQGKTQNNDKNAPENIEGTGKNVVEKQPARPSFEEKIMQILMKERNKSVFFNECSQNNS